MKVFDLETNGLLPELDRVHCAYVYDREEGTMMGFDPNQYSVDLLPDELSEVVLAGHNIIGFDIPALKKVYPGFEPRGKIVDTLIWARAVYSDIKSLDYQLYRKKILPGRLIGSHSLEAYGYRLGLLKGEFGKETDWQTWDPEMSRYCKLDVEVTNKLIDRLESKNFPQDALDLEMEVAKIIERQMQRGIKFDVDGAMALYTELIGERESLYEEIVKTFKPFWKPKGKTFTPKRDNPKLGYVVGAAMTKIELVDFNPGSSQHIYRFLRKHFGWQPTEYTEKSIVPYWIEHLFPESNREPAINEDVLKELEWEEAKPLARYQMIQKRIAQLSEGKQAWLKKVDPDGRIRGYVNSVGTRTARMTHSQPNCAQVPNSYAPYGPECRRLWQPTEGWVLVGCDADGIEARCLGHYMAAYDGGEYIQMILQGKKSDGTDVHTTNQKILELESRNTAKTFLYAFLYGSGMMNLGAILCTDPAYADHPRDPESLKKLGKKGYTKLMKGVPALKKLIDAIKQVAKERGFLRALDTRPLACPSLHSALNTVLQSAGAILMKRALVICDTNLQQAGLVPGRDYEFVLNVHDEWQVESCPDYAVLVGETSQEAIRLAGEYYKFRCPLSGSYDIGLSWEETH